MIEEYLTKKIADEFWSKLKELIRRREGNSDEILEKILAEAFAELVRPNHDLHRLKHLLQTAEETGEYSTELGVLKEKIAMLENTKYLKRMDSEFAQLREQLHIPDELQTEKFTYLWLEPTITRVLDFTLSHGYQLPQHISDLDIEAKVTAVYLFPVDWSHESSRIMNKKQIEQLPEDRLRRLLEFCEKVVNQEIKEVAIGTREKALYSNADTELVNGWRKEHMHILPSNTCILLYR